MSIEVNTLVKRFGQQVAVDHVSFSIGKGEIVGFLGPNGAGKSTTMKIMTGYLTPDEGQVKICGIDVIEDSVNARKCIGYLPESNPLYYDMYIPEFLYFVGGIYQIDNLKKRVKEVVEITGLGPEKKKQIGQLSKGYKQRVGLAHALINNPDVLILDEPTSGLDPNQLEEIRSLIRAIGKEKTVLFSTHIMQEVEALCDRAVIINQGKIVADDSIRSLSHAIRGQEMLRIQLDMPLPLSAFEEISGITEVVEEKPGVVVLKYDAKNDVRPELFEMVKSMDRKILEMTVLNSSIEDVFRELTKLEHK